MEHTWNATTCTADGVKTYTCGNCGETKTEAVSALGHTAPEQTDCTVAVNCTVCGAEVHAAKDHTYVDGKCTVCGTECEHEWDDGVETLAPTNTTWGVRTYTCGKCNETKTEEIPPKLRLASYNVVLKNNIQVNFITPAELFTEYGYTNAYAEITIESKKNGIKTITVKQEDCEIDAYGRTLFAFTDLAPDMLNNEITITLYAEYNGRKYASTPGTKTISGYIDGQLDKLKGDNISVEDKRLRTLMVDLMNYATAVQNYTGYTKYGIINSILTETEKSWGSSQTVTATNDVQLSKETFDGELLVWKGGSLSLGDAVIPNFSFVCDDLSDITIKVVCAGIEREYACVLEEGVLTYNQSNGRYVFNFNDLGVTRMREPIYLTAYKDGVAVSHTLTYSVQSYCANKLTPDSNLNNLCIAMLKYGDAANLYANG